MTRYRLIPAAILLALCLGSGCNNQANDDTITTEIKAKMFSEPSLKSAAVSISAKDGVVTLTGTVPDSNARLAAEHIASQTTGVKQVIDSTTLPASTPVIAAAVAPPPVPAPKPKPEPKPAPKKSKPPGKATPASADMASQSASDKPETEPPVTSVDPGPGPIATPPKPESPAPPPPPLPPQPATVTITEGSVISVRTIESINSDSASPGQTFRASLDAPVVVEDQVVLPKGLNARLKIVEVARAGKFEGRGQLTVSLQNITYQGRSYTFASSDVQQQGASRGKRSAAVIGGGAVLGAIIGGLAGGGKGAAIGAAAGGGTGTAVQAMTKGERVKIPSETSLEFTLHSPVQITYLPPKRPVSAAPPAPADAPAPATPTAPPSPNEPPQQP